MTRTPTTTALMPRLDRDATHCTTKARLILPERERKREKNVFIIRSRRSLASFFVYSTAGCPPPPFHDDGGGVQYSGTPTCGT